MCALCAEYDDRRHRTRGVSQTVRTWRCGAVRKSRTGGARERDAALSGHKRWWRWAFVVGRANLDPAVRARRPHAPRHVTRRACPRCEREGAAEPVWQNFSGPLMTCYMLRQLAARSMSPLRALSTSAAQTSIATRFHQPQKKWSTCAVRLCAYSTRRPPPRPPRSRTRTSL